MPCMLWNYLCILGKSNVTVHFVQPEVPDEFELDEHTNSMEEMEIRSLRTYLWPDMKTEKHIKFFLLPFGEEWRFFIFFLTIDLILISWVSVIGERLCYFGSMKELFFKSSHPQNTSNPANWALNAVWAPEQSTQMSDRLADSLAQPQTCISLAWRAAMQQWGEDSRQSVTQETHPHWEEEEADTCFTAHEHNNKMV